MKALAETLALLIRLPTAAKLGVMPAEMIFLKKWDFQISEVRFYIFFNIFLDECFWMKICFSELKILLTWQSNTKKIIKNSIEKQIPSFYLSGNWRIISKSWENESSTKHSSICFRLPSSNYKYFSLCIHVRYMHISAQYKKFSNASANESMW